MSSKPIKAKGGGQITLRTDMAKKQKSSFTAAEDAIIIEEIGNSPNNLFNAFTEAAKRLRGRTDDSIRQRYYTHLKPNVKMFMLMSAQGAVINVKSTARQKTKKSMKLELIEFALTKLSKEEKQHLIKRLTEE